jgi:hypothetical protein
VKPAPQSALVLHEQRQLSPFPGVSMQVLPAPQRALSPAQSNGFAPILQV